MKKGLTLIGMLGSLFLASAAHAGFVYNWSALASASWDIPATQFTGPSSDNSVNANVISWGTSTGLGKSSLSLFNNAPAVGVAIATNGAAIATQGLIHQNNPITGPTLLSTVLNTYLTLTPTNPVGPLYNVGLDQYKISFTETTNVPGIGNNTNDCGFTSTSRCDDIFVLTSGALDSSFVYDGFTYNIHASEISNLLGFLTASQCQKAGFTNGVCYGFVTQEGQASTIQFQFDITGTPPRDVPEPAPLALLGLGLFALFSARSRKNS
jgi:hypothetical protein